MFDIDMKANILLDESLKVKLDPKGKVIDTHGSGKLTISNPSENTTLWAINLISKHGPEVSNYEDKQIPHIQPGKPFEMSYNFSNQCNLILSERIDTYYENQDSDTLNVNHNTLIAKKTQRMLYEITLNNTYDFPLKNVVVTKQFDESVSEFELIPPFAGVIKENKPPLVWEIEKIEAKSSLTLLLVADITPKSSDRVKTGEITVTAEGAHTFTDLTPRIDAECDNVNLSVKVSETGEPTMWDVNVEFINESEFSTLLETVTVSVPEETFINETINTMYNPSIEGVAWSKQASIKSMDYPQISKDFKYQVDFDVSAVNSILIEKETDYLNVVEISSIKTFEPEQVNTYTRTPVNFIVEVTNEGTAKINRLTFEEVIPPFILVKSVKMDDNQNLDLKAHIDGLEGLDVDLPENLQQPRKLLVDAKMNDFLPGSKAKLIVECIAEKPKPNLDYSAPSRVNAYATVEKNSFEIYSHLHNETPALIVAYKTRSFKFDAKYQSISDNEYEIKINVINSGEVPLENVYVTQNIGTAKYINHIPVTVNATEKNNEVELFIKEIKIGETITIQLTVETNGPLRQMQPTVRIAD